MVVQGSAAHTEKAGPHATFSILSLPSAKLVSPTNTSHAKLHVPDEGDIIAQAEHVAAI